MSNLRLEHIYKVYPNGTKAVSDFSMDIKDKEFIVFVGPSGCGKSTTLRMIAGLEEISAGELYIDDKIVNDVEPKDRDIAMVFQNYALYPHMTVYENIAFSLKLRHVPNEEIHNKVLWAAQVLDLTEYLDRKPRAMSGGQRQRVSLGRAIIRNPKVMLLDEPLSNLDAKLRAQMRSEIAKLHEDLQTTFIYVTHDQVEAMTLGTRVVVMKLGKIMQVDTPKNLYDYPQNKFVAGFIGTPQMNFFDAYLDRLGENDKITLLNSSNIITLNHKLLSKVQARYFDGKTKVTLGIRSEHLSLNPADIENADALVAVKISHFEELGNETLIYAELLTEENSRTKPTPVIIRGTSQYGLKRGDVVKAAINVSKLHLFDSITEQIINPRVPESNLLFGQVVNNVLSFDTFKVSLPKAISLENGDYSIDIPTEAITLNTKEGIAVELVNVEKINDLYVASINMGDSLLFTTTKEEIKLEDKHFIKIDFSQLQFYQNNIIVKEAIAPYDKINGMFLNHVTAKQFVGDKYDALVESRVKEVEDYYQNEFKTRLEAKEKALAQINNVDSKAIVAKNAPLIKEKEAQTKAEIGKLKEELNKALSELTKAHKVKNVEIVANVKEAYDKVYNNEMDSFNQFKEINKDRDAYRKRVLELRQFKSNHQLERQNEINKALNSEAIDFDTETNALKGNFKREKERIVKALKDFKAQCYNEAYPTKLIEKEFNKTYKELQKEYSEKLMRAKILFFFKTGSLLTLASDQISDKMIKSLGIKVFTKQYFVEIPHNAYHLVSSNDAADSFKAKVLEVLDYGNVKYAKCAYLDNNVEKNIYLEIKDELTSEEINLSYDVEKIHITEKSMDIKIY